MRGFQEQGCIFVGNLVAGASDKTDFRRFGCIDLLIRGSSAGDSSLFAVTIIDGDLAVVGCASEEAV